MLRFALGVSMLGYGAWTDHKTRRVPNQTWLVSGTIASVLLAYEFTIEDPSTFTDQLTAVITMSKVSAQLYEYACHEGNYGMANMLRSARRRDAEAYSDTVADIFRR